MTRAAPRPLTPCEARAAQQEAALLTLLDRIDALERALQFEIKQREAMEAILTHLVARRARRPAA